MNDWQKFKLQVGLIVLCSAITYGVLITFMMLMFGTRVCDNQPLWGFLTNVISTMLGWLIAKASTIIDYIFGASARKPPQVDEVLSPSLPPEPPQYQKPGSD